MFTKWEITSDSSSKNLLVRQVSRTNYQDVEKTPLTSIAKYDQCILLWSIVYLLWTRQTDAVDLFTPSVGWSPTGSLPSFKYNGFLNGSFIPWRGENCASIHYSNLLKFSHTHPIHDGKKFTFQTIMGETKAYVFLHTCLGC